MCCVHALCVRAAWQKSRKPYFHICLLWHRTFPTCLSCLSIWECRPGGARTGAPCICKLVVGLNKYKHRPLHPPPQEPIITQSTGVRETVSGCSVAESGAPSHQRVRAQARVRRGSRMAPPRAFRWLVPVFFFLRPFAGQVRVKAWVCSSARFWDQPVI